MSHHIVLLGDSIFDNLAYTEGEPDVVTHLSRLLPSPWQATLRAVDGATVNDLRSQCPRVPSDASHADLSDPSDSSRRSTAALFPSGSQRPYVEYAADSAPNSWDFVYPTCA